MKRALPVLVCAVALALSAGGSLGAQALEPIRYTLRFPAPHTHYVEVEATVPTAGRPDVEVYMAVWTPGSYLIREYERHVEAVTANAGARALAVEKSKKNRWKITTGGAASVTLRYKVYSREMTVRNNWVEAGFAMINGAPTFLTLVERAARPHEVRIELPPSWKGVQTPLMPVAGAANAFRAEDFDTLVDSPIIIGNPVVREFTVDGKKHALVLEGDPSLFDADRAAADVKKIVEAGRNVMGPLLYPHYYFLNMIVEQGGGLEHKNSFLGMAGRYTTRTHRAYLGWLGLIAHEYFHNWNVKRMRPIELGPFDYENENYVKTLWVAEGFTDYYAGILPRRAAISHEGRILRRALESDRGGADHARPARHAGQHGVVRHLDQAVSPRRKHRQHHRELLPEGRGDRVPARREDPQVDQRRPDARRWHAVDAAALFGRAGLHARSVLPGDERGRRHRPQGLVCARPPSRPRSSITPRRSSISACASAPSTCGPRA